MSNESNEKQTATSTQTYNYPTTGIRYIGNIFLLGLLALVSELVDLQAGNVLNYLLEPFNADNSPTEQENDELLATDFSDIFDNNLT